MIKLSTENFLKRLSYTSHPDRLLVCFNVNNNADLYLIENAGNANISCINIDMYHHEINVLSHALIKQKKLYIEEVNLTPINIGKGVKVANYTFKAEENDMYSVKSKSTMYFSTKFIDWQYEHQITNTEAANKLNLTINEFKQFRDDELLITNAILRKLHETTGISVSYWEKRLIRCISSD